MKSSSPIHYAKRGYWKTACGQYTEDTDDPEFGSVTNRRDRVTCEACRERMPKRGYGITNCTCGAEFVFRLRDADWDYIPKRCSPCEMIAQAAVHEHQAKKLREQALAAKQPRDAFVVEIKRRGWTTVPVKKVG